MPLAAGMIIGLLPILIYISDFDVFIFNNLGYHITNTRWRQITNYSGPMSLSSKLLFALSITTRIENLLLAAGIFLGLWYRFKNNFRVVQSIKQLSAGSFLALSLFIVAVLIALVPTPSFRQYYALPLSFLYPIFIFSCISEDKK